MIHNRDQTFPRRTASNPRDVPDAPALLRAVEERLAGTGDAEFRGLDRLILDLIGGGIDNVRRLADQRRQFDSFVTAIAAAIDSRHPCTIAHSANVANYAVAIGYYLNLNDGELSWFRIAGHLQDVGMLAVPERILTKPERLSALETAQMRLHADYTRRILGLVAWTDELADLPEHAAAHHERLDGSGYPDALHGDEIAPRARVLAVADMFCALTEDRSYRGGLDVGEALMVLDGMTPNQLDGSCVAALRRFLGCPPEPPMNVVAA